jgi:carbon-monoxide dehydrogenase medium subunit
MIPSAFDYVRADNVAHALQLLTDGGDDAKFLAGGQSLLPMMKFRLANPSRLIDLAGIAPLHVIDASRDGVRIGALATHDRIALHDEIRRILPAIADAAAVIGDPQIRNFGTIGGSSVHSDPGADYPAVLLALDAIFELTSTVGSRQVAADAFFIGMYETSLRADRELLTAIDIASAPQSAYVKIEHPASGYAVAGGAVRLEITEGCIASARVAITGVGEIAFRSAAVEEALTGLDTGDDAAIRLACTNAAAGIDPQGDRLCPPDYRFAMADVAVARAVRRALGREGPY